MSSNVDIANTALAHLGSDAQIVSIDPADGSVEAGYARRFLPIARREMLEQADWTFALRRATMAEVANNSIGWAYAYSLPADCMKPRRVITASLYNNVFNAPIGFPDEVYYFSDDSLSAPFTVEERVLYTNEEQATLLYLVDETNPTKFTPTFVSALGYLLASYMAGPLIRGSEGAQAAQRYRELAMGMAGRAITSNANSSARNANHVAGHLSAR